MKRRTWRKYHKWTGLIISFFLVMFCLSGIVLNHRRCFADINVSRVVLPGRYDFKHWNNGLLRGTLRCKDDKGHDMVLIYGAAGVIRTDTAASIFIDYNQGLPSGADYRQMRGVVRTKNGQVFAASVMGLYQLKPHHGWQSVALPEMDSDDLLSDITTRGDTLVALSRSYLYYATAPYRQFHRVEIQPAVGDDGKVSLFRQVWLLHSGGLFGTVGKLVVDLIALILIALCVTGVWFWVRPKHMKVLNWHNKIGVFTIVLTLFTAITGWALRPPVMIPLTMNNTHPLPGTVLASDNAWYDCLRMIRYDEQNHDWLLSTSKGFCSLSSLTSKPQPITIAPSVSVMGQTVWQRDESGMWLVGSFDGLFRWNRQAGRIEPYNNMMVARATIPGTAAAGQMVVGYSSDFTGEECVADYYDGTFFSAQPEELRNMPMSLWSLALEVHTGRIYAGAIGSFLFIFVAGLFVIIALWSGKKS